MSLDRKIMDEMRRQRTIKLRLAQYEARTGFTLPARVPVTLEQLMDVRAQLEAHFKRAADELPSLSHLN